MNIIKFLLLACASVSLMACAGSPYPEGKSPADVPGNVNIIRLNQIQMADSGVQVDKFPDVIAEPSENDQAVLRVMKRSIINQLTNYGYTVLEDEKGKADITFQPFGDYVPEYGLLVHRAARLTIYVLNQANEILFSKRHDYMARNGLLDAMFMSRDDVAADVAIKGTIATVNEMRKGTLDN